MDKKFLYPMNFSHSKGKKKYAITTEPSYYNKNNYKTIFK